MIAIFSLFTVAFLSLLVTRIASMAFMLTGLSREAARFQARSAFSGVGFTTSESELIVNHPVRRKITMILMLLGNIGIATVVATIIASLLSTAGSTNWLRNILLFMGCLSLLWFIAVSHFVERHLNRVIAWGLKKWTRIQVQDYVAILHLQNEFAVWEMKVESDNWLAGKSLIEAGLSREGVLILGIQKKNGAYIGAPQGISRIFAGDVLVMYGPLQRLEEIDQRKAGKSGDREHHESIAEHQDELKAQAETEDHKK
ncbi:MAG: TrkA C-terminal domain-containing protein [Desulfobulbales bacterium]|nr:TrkA C-terminal domain-containing protein [Desulfobulbales bacterium]